MAYCSGTPNRGLILKPKGNWDREDRNYEFEVTGRSDSNYATDPDTRKSVTGCRVLLEGTPVMFRSSTQRIVSLSVTESEMRAAVTCAQDMIFTMRILESIGLKVKLPMILEPDNQGVVDLANNWSIGGRTRHVEVTMCYLRELKEQGLLRIQHIPGTENDADMHTKNLGGPDFNRHGMTYYGRDEYYRGLGT